MSKMCLIGLRHFEQWVAPTVTLPSTLFVFCGLYNISSLFGFRPRSRMDASGSSSTRKSTAPVCHSPSASTFSSPSFCLPRTSQLQWSCKACTFLNAYDRSTCEMCGKRVSLLQDLASISEDEASGYSVFWPLRSCKGMARENDSDQTYKSCGHKSSKHAIIVSEETKQSLSTLKILSYNVWFNEELEIHKRMRALGDLIRQYSPDVICFQEVTPNIYGIFKQSTWWNMYSCSVSSKMVLRPYFCMQLSKLPVNSFTHRPFKNSIMGRELSVADINAGPNRRFLIATTHLESPCPAPPTWDQMFSEERVAQAKDAIGFLSDAPNVIFGGDMNWDENLDGPFPLSEVWFDAWTELRPGESGWTYDTKTNKMLSANRTLQKRLDRFVCKLEDFQVNQVEMIGQEAIPGVSYIKEKKIGRVVKQLELPVFPSDHYGLFLTISEKQ